MSGLLIFPPHKVRILMHLHPSLLLRAGTELISAMLESERSRNGRLLRPGGRHRGSEAPCVMRNIVMAEPNSQTADWDVARR